MILYDHNQMDAVIGRIRGADRRVWAAIRRCMLRISIVLQQHVVERKLRGQVLQHRTGKLARSVNQRVVDSGNEIAAIVTGGGSTATYGYVHEFGGTFDIPEHMSFSRTGKAFMVRAHQATYPEKSFMRSSLVDLRARFARDMNDAVAEALEQ